MAILVPLISACIITGALIFGISIAYYLRLNSCSTRLPYFRSLHLLHVGDLNVADMLAVLSYLSINAAVIYFASKSLQDSGLKAADATLANMMWLYIGPCVTNFFGISLRRLYLWHSTVGITTFALLLAHLIIFDISRASFRLDNPHNAGGLAAILFMVVVLHTRLLRGISYDMSLCLHQICAAGLVFAMWKHLPSRTLLPHILFYIISGSFLCLTLLLASLILYRNGAISHKFPRGKVSYTGGALILKVRLQRPLKLRPGQFVTLWIPSVSLWQWHPFVVLSYRKEPLTTLEFLIQPRKGFTQNLIRKSTGGMHLDDEREHKTLVLFSGPRGRSVSIDNYEVFLLIASGYGISAQLPYLSAILHGDENSLTRFKRVHLVWQLNSYAESYLVRVLNQELGDPLNAALRFKNFGLSIHNVHLRKKKEEIPSERAKHIRDAADWKSIITAEAEGDAQQRTNSTRKIGVLVSASSEIRHELREIKRQCRALEFDLIELDYQPV